MHKSSTQNTKLIGLLVQDSQISQVQFNQIRELVLSQNAELVSVLSGLFSKQTQKELDKLITVKERFDDYRVQLLNFPDRSLSADEMYLFASDLLESSHELIRFI